MPTLILGISGFLSWRNRLRDELRLTGLLLGLGLTALFFLASIGGPPYLYLVRWIVVINCFIWLNLIWVVSRTLREWAAQQDFDRRHGARALTILILGGSAAALLALGLVPLGRSTVYAENLVGSAAIRSLEARIDDSITGCGLIEVHSTSDQVVTGPAIASGVVADLHQRHIDAVMEDLFEYSHGPEHSLTGRRPDCTLTISVATAAAIAPVPPSDGEHVASFDSLNRRERLEYQRLTRKKQDKTLDDTGRSRLRQLRSEAQSVRVSIVHHETPIGPTS